MPLLPKLRGYFAEFLLHASPAHLRLFASSTCVGLRYGCKQNSLRGFSWRAFNHFIWSKLRISSGVSVLDGGFAYRPTYFPNQAIPSACRSYLPRHPIGQTLHLQLRNIDLIPIDYALGPYLRGRLNLGGRTLPRNPCSYGGRDSHSPFRYSCQHSHFWYLHKTSRSCFQGLQNALLPSIN